MIIWCLSFHLLIWCNTLTCLLKNPWIPVTNPNWSWCMSFWCVAEFCLLKFCWGFLHLCSPVILACNFLFLCCLCLVLVSGWLRPHRISLEVFLPLPLASLFLVFVSLATSGHGFLWIFLFGIHSAFSYCGKKCIT